MKKFLGDCLRVFTLSYLGSSVCAALFITVFIGPLTAVSIVVIWELMLVSLLSTLGNFFYLSKKEPSAANLIVRRVLHFLYVDAVVLLCGYFCHWLDFSEPWEAVFLEVGILVIFVVISLIEYFHGKSEADKLNSLLKEKREKKEESDGRFRN